MHDDQLKHIPEKQLRAELERRKIERGPKPTMLVIKNWDTVEGLAVRVRDTVAEGEYVDSDLPTFIFEEVMVTVFGSKYFEWHNKNVR